MMSLSLYNSLWEIRGWFCKRVVLANLPSFRFSFPGERANVPSFQLSFQGNIRQNQPFGKPPFGQPREQVLSASRAVIISGQNLAKKKPKIITSHDVLGTFKTSTFGITCCDNFWPNLRLEVAEGCPHLVTDAGCPSFQNWALSSASEGSFLVPLLSHLHSNGGSSKIRCAGKAFLCEVCPNPRYHPHRIGSGPTIASPNRAGLRTLFGSQGLT